MPTLCEMPACNSFECKFKLLRDWRFPIPFEILHVVKLFDLAQIGNGLRYLATEAICTYLTQIRIRLFPLNPHKLAMAPLCCPWDYGSDLLLNSNQVISIKPTQIGNGPIMLPLGLWLRSIIICPELSKCWRYNWEKMEYVHSETILVLWNLDPLKVCAIRLCFYNRTP